MLNENVGKDLAFEQVFIFYKEVKRLNDLLLHIRRILIKQELFNADIKNAVIVVHTSSNNFAYFYTFVISFGNAIMCFSFLTA